ncbi:MULTISPECIES: SDR family NAD(P)-dependent oxidoreductase [unclassified Undibacterium]|uniref:SDR family NAD(P)-dependent oxidoreductase n=1 Tax=unclassified Undibacterium TaxID=2630295 RepID=UPI002AC90E08|nr:MULTISPECIES: SDR family NAD(P)-dependent oxidoreductase [unclassified Undibacterium]MEB0138485.1 SDR family NAD(P)-dependent oxidoreductase [Undibacterium sp. CCC2.1]MEB0173908.1 SDR family NAD(P)-dependent oxidoreductase [Undibacterium sp. CCC1.1]MEB0176166.1 SDR family NAD(P)-dependent oxidoreductase [Undibacterium sp. CCC3.4]MEB0215432.1 SDR family NAD(P)-dependent oxidoreductase [Undibacterium sp. 5I2]WPX42772.1 SDR family NAD(P)-dependent oxidoreductase [Undibacterium sp. CCC3.4]
MLRYQRARIVIIGATSAIASQCARRWLAGGAAACVLLGRNAEKLAVLEADLRLRYPLADISSRCLDFLDVVAIEACAAELVQGGPIDIALIAHGNLPLQAACQADVQLTREALLLNAISPALFAEAFAARMQQQGGGCLALISSVAGERGRKSNYVYGAAKALLSRYAEGLQHRFAGTPLHVVLIKPGPTASPMTAHLLRSGVRLAPLGQVADAIVAGIAKHRAVIYVPRKWALIMLLIRVLPRAIFNKLNI